MVYDALTIKLFLGSTCPYVSAETKKVGCFGVKSDRTETYTKIEKKISLTFLVIWKKLLEIPDTVFREWYSICLRIQSIVTLCTSTTDQRDICELKLIFLSGSNFAVNQAWNCQSMKCTMITMIISSDL